MHKLKPLAAALAALSLTPLAAVAAPSTCWQSSKDPYETRLLPFSCDVELINKHKPDAVFYRTGQSHWLVDGMRIFTDYSNNTATVVFRDGAARYYRFKVDSQLDWVLTGSDNYQFAFAPSDGFKSFLRSRINGATQPASNVLSDTPFRY